jgi:hypothetical protein
MPAIPFGALDKCQVLLYGALEVYGIASYSTGVLGL